jgi:amidase
MSDDVHLLDATAQAELIARGEATPLELVTAAIARLEAVDPALNAVIHRTLERAHDRAAAGDVGDGPFGGVPFLLKDLVCCEEGVPFHEGNAHLREIGHTGDHDQVLAQRFRAAGLVSLGRTNTPEFGMRPVCEPVAHGPTNNPWDLERSPGGSSGGSAAAVAAGIVPVAHASDVGGSIRAPASHCGLVGLKPSRGRSTMAPDFFDAMGGLAEELVVSRSVRDTAAVLDAVGSRPHIGDWYPTWPVSGSYVDDARTDPGRLRIGFAADHAHVAVHGDVAATVRSVAATLEALGHHVTEERPAALDEDISAFALAHYTAGTAWLVDEHWPRVLGHALPEDGIEPVTAFLVEVGRSVSGAGLLAARELAQRWTRRLAAWWEDVDVLLLPVVPVPPPRTGDDHDDAMLITFVAPFNISGQPAISVPGAVHDGLPIGVQLVAAHGRDDVLIRLAAQLEGATGWLDRRPPPPA